MENNFNWKQKFNEMLTRFPDISMADTVYNTLLDAIVSFQVPPGSKLVVLHLAEEMGISMTPLREAITRLEDEGFVSSTEGRKTFVSGYNENSSLNLRALRVSLECLAAELVCEVASDSFIAELAQDVETNIGYWEKCKDDFNIYYSKQIIGDLNFHRKLVHGSQNQFLIEQYDRIWPSITFVRQFFSPFGFSQAEYPQAHRAIPRALATRNPQFARAAMMMHFQNVYSAKRIETP